MALLRQQQELQQLEAELRGEAPEHPVEIAGTSLPTRKRPASTAIEGSSFSKMLKLHPNISFTGESLEELNEFANGWRTLWDHPQWAVPDSEKIAYAAISLKGTALTRWSSRTVQPATWDKFLDTLRSYVRDPANRMADAMKGIWRYHHKDGKTVRDVLDDLVKFRTDIPEMSGEQRHAWELLLAIKPEIRSRVQQELPSIDTEDQVLRSAHRHEELLQSAPKDKGKARDYAGAVKHTPSKRPSAPARANPPRSSTGTAEKQGTPASQPKDLVCWTCNKPGHYSSNCPQAGSKGSASVSADKQPKKKEKDGAPKK